MTKIERKLFDWAGENLMLLAFVVFTVLAVALRIACIDYESGDYSAFLSPWYNTIADAGIEGLKTQVGNYNIPYQILIYLMQCLNL